MEATVLTGCAYVRQCVPRERAEFDQVGVMKEIKTLDETPSPLSGEKVPTADEGWLTARPAPSAR